MHAPMLPCAAYGMELVARRLAVKTPVLTAPGRPKAASAGGLFHLSSGSIRVPGTGLFRALVA